MKTNNIQFIVKTFFILFLLGCSNANKTSFGLLKKSSKKSNSNSNSQNLHQTKSQTKQNDVTITANSGSNFSLDPNQSNPQRAPTLPDQPIYAQGWIKYLHYDDAGKQKPKMFWKNTAYETELRDPEANSDPNADEFGSLKIPNEKSFFAIFYKDTMNVLSSRRKGYLSIIDSLNYEYIPLIPESNPKNGGVKDYGNFKEGFCFKVQTEIPEEKFVQTPQNLVPEKKKYVRWVICTETEEQKKKFMDILIKLKIKNQRSKNLYIDFEKDANAPVNDPLKNAQMQKRGVGSVYEESKDCKMIVLHDWSECTLSCGGGKSYLQLMKIMKKPDGEDCKTKESILTRDCNMQPCPTQNAVKIVTEKIKIQQAVASNATVKMMSISARPQRYDKCHLKEGDALMMKKDDSVKEFTNYPLVPVRVVMNEKTFTAYQDDNLKNKIVTYLLNETAFFRVKDKKCFIIKNNVQEDQFCMLDSAKGDFVEEWDYDFNLFKFQCAKPRVKSNERLEKKKLMQEFNNKVEDLKLEMVKDKADALKKQIGQDEKKKLVNRVDLIRKTSLQALQKEMRLEDLLEKEEESKEDEENKVLEQQIMSEKKKEDCLMRAIKEKEVENQYNIAKNQADRAIEQITKQTQIQIVEQRKSIARKITEMRQKQKRKKAQLKNEIMSIRTQIAERLQKINRTGKKESCLNQSNKADYCSANFSDNYVKFGECNSDDSFCYVCCENEFGELHVVDRDNCYTACDSLSSKNTAAATVAGK